VNGPLKLFFDENMSSLLATELFDFYKIDYPDLVIKHLRDFTRASSPDPKWISLLSKEPGWVVISGDRGVNSTQDLKLPLICKQYSISLIMLTGGAVKRGKASQRQSIVGVWDEIVSFSKLKAGSTAVLGNRTIKGGIQKSFLRIKDDK
jgi:hypothetical protein